MSHRFDASTKYLLATHLADWLSLLGRPVIAPVEIIEADLSTVSSAADKILRVHETPPWLLDVEVQSSRNPKAIPNLQLYSALLENRFGLLVRSLLVLLRREADSPDITGLYERQFDNEVPYLVFRYQVVRVWKLDPQVFLSGGLGILPLAPLSNMAEAALPGSIHQMEKRINQEAQPEVGTLWTATAVLMGLRYPRDLVIQLLQGVHAMKESSFYQGILEEGRVEGALLEAAKLLLRSGRARFGLPNKETVAAIEAIRDLNRLEQLHERLLAVSTWQELLATP